MGLELSYQALPGDCGLLERARADAAFAERVQFIASVFGAERPTPDKAGRVIGGETDPVWDWCCNLAGDHPDLADYNLYLDRWWDKLHYLLSARRRGTDEAVAPIDHAFDGGAVISEQACATQGAPLRWVAPPIAADIAGTLAALAFRDVAVRYHVSKMEAASVYKHNPPVDEASELRTLAGYFGALQFLFTQAAARRYGVLVCLD